LRSAVIGVFTLLWSHLAAQAIEFHNAQLESQVEALFAGNRDFAEIKLTIDRMAAPGVDVAASLKVIDGMAADIERMRAQAGP
jgi:hypothetical protein